MINPALDCWDNAVNLFFGGWSSDMRNAQRAMGLQVGYRRDIDLHGCLHVGYMHINISLVGKPLLQNQTDGSMARETCASMCGQAPGRSSKYSCESPAIAGPEPVCRVQTKSCWLLLPASNGGDSDSTTKPTWQLGQRGVRSSPNSLLAFPQWQTIAVCISSKKKRRTNQTLKHS